MPNIPETLIAFLATASLGAIWSSAAPEFGARSVIDRFAQIEPKVLLTVDGYRHGGKDFDRMAVAEAILAELPTVEHAVLLPYLSDHASAARLPGEAMLWAELAQRGEGAELSFEQVPFDHPLWVLYSSGTTGLPKAIVQGHGGILIEQLKKRLHLELRPGDRMFWFTTTGWMMWNFLVGCLLCGRGDRALRRQPGPSGPGRALAPGRARADHVHGAQRRAARELREGGHRAGPRMRPERAARDRLDRLAALAGGLPLGLRARGLGRSGCSRRAAAPTSALRSSAAVRCCRSTKANCSAASLGCAVESWDEQGVAHRRSRWASSSITEPMPSMPLFLWGDEDGERLRESYFSMYPGIWRHGDWIRITPRDGAVIYGRSDSTINRQGVRMGTSEIYRAAASVPQVLDALVIDIPARPGEDELRMILFVVLAEGTALDEELTKQIKRRIREDCSPRHVPNEIRRIEEVPRTLSGKVLEVPVKRILMGSPVNEAASVDSLANPRSLDYFVSLAGELDVKPGDAVGPPAA